MPDLPLYSALGCAVTLDAADRPASDLAEIARAWEGAVVQDDDPLPARHISVPVPAGAIDHAVALLSQAVTLTAIDARRGDLWMLHAGAVADDEGRVVAVVGPSGRGKTTATRALAERFAYVTDETVGVAADGTVLPYRKPLSIVVDPVGDKAQRSPAELGLSPLAAPALRLAAVVLLDRDPAMGERADLRSADVGDALAELVEQTSYLAELPTPLRTIAAHLAAVGGVHRVTYGEASALPDALAPLFVDPAEPVLPAPPPRALPATERGVRRWFRAAHLDALSLERDGDLPRLALLQPETDGRATFRMLEGIGPVLWAEASGAGRDELRDAVVARHGAPHGPLDASEIIDAVLGALVDEGVLADAPAWRVRSDVAWTGDAGAYVALALSAPGSPQPISLEGTAGLIWSVVTRSRGATSDALVDAIREGIGAAPEAVHSDVVAFLEALRTQGLVELFTP